MAETIIQGKNFNVDVMKYMSPKVNSSNGKSVNILNKKTNTGIRLATPLMLTWGADDYKDDKGVGNGKFEMALQFPSDEYITADTSAFLENLVAMEEKIKQDALANSKEWFGKMHKNEEVINALWTPMLKYPRDKATGEPDKSKSPTLRVKIQQWEGQWKSEIYDEDQNVLFPSRDETNKMTPVDYLQKGTHVAVVIQCGGLWFANGKFGVTWKLLQAVVQKPKAALQGTCFIALDKGEKERMNATSHASTDEDTQQEVCEIVPDSDEEEDDGDQEEVEEEEEEESEPVPEPEPEPLPEPTKKKKVVRKKASA
jgi:hypothetical protein